MNILKEILELLTVHCSKTVDGEEKSSLNNAANHVQAEVLIKAAKVLNLLIENLSNQIR